MIKGFQKKLISIILFLVIIVAGMYFLIPGEITLSVTSGINANQHPAYRAIITESKWPQWWPGKKDSVYSFRGNVYVPAQKLFEGVEIIIQTPAYAVNSLLIIHPLSTETSELSWKGSILTGNDPFSRISSYIRAQSIKRDMKTILSELKHFLQKQENLYDISIKSEKVKDTFLVTLKSVREDYPEMSTVYSMIDTLRNYLLVHEARETNAPMLHVQQFDESQFEVMVALPVDRQLPDEPPVFFKRMVAGNILVTEIKGGRLSIYTALNQLENYIDDYKKSSPALPFQSLITNRLKEPDTSKWVTRIYYPIF
jgi:hypothetical protein